MEKEREERRKRRKEKIVCRKKDGFFVWKFLKINVWLRMTEPKF